MLKTTVLGMALAAAGVGAGLAGRADSAHSQRNSSPPAECVVAVASAPGYLPRAGLTVENRRPHPIQVRLEARTGSGLDRVELGAVGAGGHRFFGHALPAGRNVLMAGDGQPRPQIITVVNRGAETCVRHYRLRLE